MDKQDENYEIFQIPYEKCSYVLTFKQRRMLFMLMSGITVEEVMILENVSLHEVRSILRKKL